jgi:DNA-directed RNA polymerase specialized sigma24 family protein
MERFPSTQWSLIRRSGQSADGGQAFGELARLYRPAIVAFFRAHLGADAAEDAAQSFLAASYESVWWPRADADLGSFRGFLLMLLRRHLGHVRTTLSPMEGDAHAIAEAIDDKPGADRQFDSRFALLLTANAIAAQRERYRQRDRDVLFEQLLPLLSSPPEHGELKAIAATLRMPPNTLTVELQRLRKRLREEMRAQLSALCADEETLAGEWTMLQRILDGT